MPNLPINRTPLTAAQTNQVPNALIRSALNIAAIQEPYDTIDLLYNYTNGLISAGTLSRLGIINVKDYNASGSANTYTGTIASGSQTLTLTTSSHDFAAGQGISIPGAGVAAATLVTTVLSVSGTTVTIATSASTAATSVTVKHDDTAAILQAIAVATNTTTIYAFATESKITTPEGTYNITSLPITKNLHIEGNGAKFVCTASLNSIAINSTAEVLEIRNLTLVSTGNMSDGLNSIGIKRSSPSYSDFYNVKVRGFSKSGIELIGSLNTRIAKCYINKNNYGINLPSGGTTIVFENNYISENVRGINADSATDLLFLDQILEVNTYGMYLNNCQRCTAIRPYCEANVTKGVYLSDTFLLILDPTAIGANDGIQRVWTGSWGVPARAYSQIDSYGASWFRHMWLVGDTSGTPKEISSSGANNENPLYDSRPILLSQSNALTASASYHSELALDGTGIAISANVIKKAYGSTYTATKAGVGVYNILFGRNINQPCIMAQVLSANNRWTTCRALENIAGDWVNYRIANGYQIYIYSDAALTTLVDDYVSIKITVSEL